MLSEPVRNRIMVHSIIKKIYIESNIIRGLYLDIIA